MNGNLILIQEITSGSFLLQNLVVEAGVQLMSSEFHPIRKLFLKAFEYRGKFARIEGFDQKHDSYNINVINKVVSILAKDGVNQVIVNTLTDYIERSNADQRDAIIDELVSDKDTRNCLLNLAASGIELSETEGTVSLRNKMVSSVFGEDPYDTDVIVKLWNAGYDLADYFDELRYALNLWAESDSGKGRKFLDSIKLEGFQKLYLEEHLSQINDSLLLLLRKVFDEENLPSTLKERILNARMANSNLICQRYNNYGLLVITYRAIMMLSGLL